MYHGEQSQLVATHIRQLSSNQLVFKKKLFKKTNNREINTHTHRGQQGKKKKIINLINSNTVTVAAVVIVPLKNKTKSY